MNKKEYNGFYCKDIARYNNDRNLVCIKIYLHISLHTDLTIKTSNNLSFQLLDTLCHWSIWMINAKFIMHFHFLVTEILIFIWSFYEGGKQMIVIQKFMSNEINSYTKNTVKKLIVASRWNFFSEKHNWV